jgi:hypothetical protein
MPPRGVASIIVATQFIVHPQLGAAVSVYLPLAVVTGLVTAAKGRFGWFAIGLATGGLGFLFGAAATATPDSLWARAFYGPAKM